MRTTFVLVAAVCTLLSCVAFAALASEDGSPACVLERYSQAYSSKDAALLEELYADDYQWVAVVPRGAELFGRAKTMAAARGMFAHPDVSESSLTLSGEFEVVDGTTPGTWRIEGIEAALVVVLGEDADPHITRTCATLYVRETEEGSGVFQIYREVTFGDGDCAAWGEPSTP